MQITYPGFDFKITKQAPGCNARLGILTTPHGQVETPNFIFCATKAAIRIASPAQMRAAGTQIILGNTYHLMLQPGAELVARQGGLHKFMGWDGPMLTDSGGFQVFSLNYGGIADEIKSRGKPKRDRTMLKITEDGATFKSYIDGSLYHLTPERSIDVQRKLGADIILMFDECTPFHVEKDYTARSMQLTHRWGKRSIEEFERGHDGRQGLYGISQGGVFEDLRLEAAQWLNEQPFFGYAVGGCLGQSKQQFHETVAFARKPIRNDKPVHLLGVGDVEDLWELVQHGIDTFDCVAPTRIARHGWALSRFGKNFRLNMYNAQYRDDPNPLDETIISEASGFSRAYIHHLLKANEILGMHLLALHNAAFMNALLAEIRASIREDRYEAAKKEWLGN